MDIARSESSRIQRETWWKAFSWICLQSDDDTHNHLPGEATQELESVFKHNYKGRPASGSPLFAAIEFCAIGPDAKNPGQRSEEETNKVLRRVLAARADPESWACHSAGKLQAVHYASGLGSISALEALRGSYGQGELEKWKQSVTRKTKNSDGSDHYSPLHDAVWFDRTAVVTWLLRENADANATNMNGMTPLGLVAQLGHHHMVLELIKQSASLTGKFSRGTSPLQTAVNNTQFPIEKFHLLAASCHSKNPTLIDYLRDVHELAIENVQAADIFVNILLGRHEEKPTNEEVEEGQTKFKRCHWSGLQAAQWSWKGSRSHDWHGRGQAKTKKNGQVIFSECDLTGTSRKSEFQELSVGSLFAFSVEGTTYSGRITEGPTFLPSGDISLTTDAGYPSKLEDGVFTVLEEVHDSKARPPLSRTRSWDEATRARPQPLRNLSPLSRTRSCPDDPRDARAPHRPPLLRSTSSVASYGSAPLGGSPLGGSRRRSSQWVSQITVPAATAIDNQALLQMASILRHAPRAAGDILEMLLDDPLVQNSQHHPLPLRANLGDHSSGGDAHMICKYVDDVDAEKTGPCWLYDTSRSRRNKDSYPQWHDSFAPWNLKRNDDVEVEVKVLRIPRILDTRIVRSIARTSHLQLFAQRTVQAIVQCFWNEIVRFKVYIHMLFLELSVLIALTVWVLVATEHRQDLQRFCWAVLAATVLRESFVLIWVFRARCDIIGLSFTTYDVYHICSEASFTGTLFVLVWATRATCDCPAIGTWLRGFLASNFTLRWIRIMSLLRSQKNVGPKIVCIVKSFLPMFEMMLVAFVLFAGWSVSAILMSDEELSLSAFGALTLELFKALLLGDGEAFNNLRGLKGADSSKLFSTTLVVTASMVFTICVLNLFMAVYSSEYDQKQAQSSQLFFQERANISFEFLIEPPWPQKVERVLEKVTRSVDRILRAFVRFAQRRLTWIPLRLGSRRQPNSNASMTDINVVVVLIVVVAFCASHVLSSNALDCPVCAAIVFAGMQLLVQTFTLRCTWLSNKEGERFYLWICYSRHAFETDDTSQSQISLKSEVLELRKTVEELTQQLEYCFANGFSPKALSGTSAFPSRPSSARGRPAIDGDPAVSMSTSASPKHRNTGNDSISAAASASLSFQPLQKCTETTSASSSSPRSSPRVRFSSGPL